MFTAPDGAVFASRLPQADVVSLPDLELVQEGVFGAERSWLAGGFVFFAMQQADGGGVLYRKACSGGEPTRLDGVDDCICASGPSGQGPCYFLDAHGRLFGGRNPSSRVARVDSRAASVSAEVSLDGYWPSALVGGSSFAGIVYSDRRGFKKFAVVSRGWKRLDAAGDPPSGPTAYDVRFVGLPDDAAVNQIEAADGMNQLLLFSDGALFVA